MVNRIVAYPARFELLHDDGDYYSVTFDDLPDTFTDARSLAQAIYRAEEVLGLMLYDAKVLPPASNVQSIQNKYPDDYVALIVCDLDKAAKEVTVPYVKKNTRIPADLAKRAESAGLNFSATLTEALKAKLG
ncbi:type II toxin-antitoxin system HicB family antitoxin [Agrilactobacillus yilanensis]|uniref:Type II toxin-antitoxin system HicB family antitoxin n=1 Tax=Agrilactobacillus yilanensis TaxID=2485997 RepID=A0ABW4JD28_9LACO|nr:type II toxin-antitoxin system HicB family antitoxin [Agrilactobacillus yilanensis]